MSEERKVIGMISVVAFSNGDTEVKVAGIPKEQAPKVFLHLAKVTSGLKGPSKGEPAEDR